MSLKDFKPDDMNFDLTDKDKTPSENRIESSGFNKEINTLKIDKLSNRITIISIIIPCLIGAILIFAYLDMKERVVDIDQTKNSQVERIYQQLEEKLNALDLKIAKNKYDFDNQIPRLSKKQVSLEGQMAKLTSAKADTKSLKSLRSTLEKQIAKNTKSNKTTLQRAENMNNKVLAAIVENKQRLEKTATQINDEFKLFKEEFDARLLELSEYEQELGGLRKDFSLLDKKFKRLEHESVSLSVFEERTNRLKIDLLTRISKIKSQVTVLDQKLATNLSRLQKDIDLLIKSSTARGPQPQINIDASDTKTIDQKPLAQ